MRKIDGNNIEDILALSPNQEGILFHYLKNPKGQQYNIQMLLKLRGNINYSKLKKAWDYILNQNEMLRTVFRWINVKQPIQLVMKTYTPQIEFYDFEDNNDSIDNLISNDEIEPFNLEESCYRIKLCKICKDEYIMIMNIHHIIYDGWSNGILWEEFFSIYRSLVKENKIYIPPKTKYKQYIKHSQKKDKRDEKIFWKNYMKNIHRIPLLRQNSTNTSHVNKSTYNLKRKLDHDINSQLTTFLQENNLNLSNLIYSAWGLLLQFYCNSKDIVFGRVSSGRNIDLKGIQDMVGLFINIHPFRIQLEDDITLVEYLQNIKTDILKLEEYETNSLNNIKSYFDIKSGMEIFNNIVVIENYPLNKEVLRNNETISIEDFSVRESNHYDLTLLVETFDDIIVNIIYDKGIFEESFIDRILNHLNNILRFIINKPNSKISDVCILDQDEKNEILSLFNNTIIPFEKEKTVIDLFEEQVKENPDRIAIEYKNLSLTYSQFNERVNKLAHYLRELGVKSNDIVGLMLQRSFEMMIGIFAIVKAGGAYLPIDPKNPQKRINYIIEDADINIILTQGQYMDKINSNIRFIDLGSINALDKPITNPKKINKPNDICYVIYTSGTTGDPKGVCIEHRSLVNRLIWMQKNSPIGLGDTVLQKTIYVFDVSVWEIFWWGIQGSKLCLLEGDGEKNPQILLDTICKNRITTLHFVPSMFNAFLLYLETSQELDKLSKLKYVICSGEALTPDMVYRFNSLAKDNQIVKLTNLYGPTEATIDVSYYNCSRSIEVMPEVPIGKPIDNISLFVTSPWGQLQPVGVSGELCIAGEGLARRYLNKPEITSKKFIHSSFLQQKRVYKTGDLAKWLPDGNIKYLGRIDSQVKVRGYRIELGEIENVIGNVSGIKDVVAIVKKHNDGESYIYAYIISDNPLDKSKLRREISNYLPSYMVPSFFIKVKEFPVKANGKVDKARLIMIDNDEDNQIKKTYTPHQSEIQRLIIGIWKEVLSNDDVGINADLRTVF